MSDLSLDGTQLERYSRHIIMDGVGPAGQRSLLDGRVLVVGAGGLGAPAIQYLAAAGVGQLGIIDDDVVERSNLQRQVVHGDGDVGEKKVDSAAAFVAQLNPDVTIETYDSQLNPENAPTLVADYDFVVDGSDNFRTRYLVNDACTLAEIPFSHGAIYRFEGQVTTFENGSPCYRCLFPEAPPDGTVPDCATTGVLGVLPGVVGSIQATETVKYLMSIGESLDGRLLSYDALAMRFEELPIGANPDCPVCGESSIDSMNEIEYAGSCAVAD
jgi:molybdopterin/thiamine biosynthesis adenylyltransferase